MAELVRRERRKARGEPLEFIEPFDRWFEPMFDRWGRWLPLRAPALFGRSWLTDVIPVDEYRENGSLVVRAELPGIDPDKDVELTVSDQMLEIRAERREEEAREGKTYKLHELRYGSFTRTLPLPMGVTESDVKASYKDGILEIRIPAQEITRGKKVAIEKG